ncbi:MAG: type II toxin-antitoxin system HicA family toxin [bacterium]|nr:type II toxin-antitoxin system HicA family toxin [bacterium]
MKRRKLLVRIARGEVENVAFSDFLHLVESHGFALRRISGSHYIYRNPRIPKIVNIQDVGGQAKPYQVRQFLRLVERYELRMES